MAHLSYSPPRNFHALYRQPEVRQIVRDVGREYSRVLGETLMQRYQAALKTMVELGAKQTPPVTLSTLDAGERDKWVRGLPNLAGEWAKTNAGKGPTKDIVKTYMDGLRARGVKPAREWEKEI